MSNNGGCTSLFIEEVRKLFLKRYLKDFNCEIEAYSLGINLLQERSNKYASQMLSIIQNSWESVVKGYKNKVNDLEIKLEAMAMHINEIYKQVNTLKDTADYQK